MSSNPPAPDSANPIPGTSAEAGIELAAATDAEAAPPAGDRSFEFSLRLLTVVVLLALVGSVSLLAYRIVSPRFADAGAGAVAVTASRPKPAPSAQSTGPSKNEEVLMDPRQVFRCEEQGRVSFSDHACTEERRAAPAAPAAVTAPGR